MVKFIGFASVILLTAMPGAAFEENIRDVTFKAEFDQSVQHDAIVLPKEYDRAKPHDLLVTLHGYGSDRWQFLRSPRDECRAARNVAAENKMDLLSPDSRAPDSWMVPAAEADLVQILCEVK